MSCACASEPRHQLRLVNIIKHSEETYSYDLDMTDLPTWAEGDSSKVFLSIGEKEVGKAFSHATLPKEGVIRFTTRIKEVPSDYKAELAKKQPDIMLFLCVRAKYPPGNWQRIWPK